MRLPAWFVRSVSFGVLHKLNSGVDAVAAAEELRRVQWSTTDELRTYQDRKLRSLVTGVAASVPYYRRWFAENGVDPATIRGVEDLGRLPLMQKAIINANRSDFLHEGVDVSRLRAGSTGGSTGQIFHFYQDVPARSGILGTQMVNAEWMGAAAGAPYAYLWGSPIERHRAHDLMGRIKNAFQNSIYLSAYGMDQVLMDQYIARLRSWKPEILVAYPSALSDLSRRMLESGVAAPPLKGIVCTSETLLPEQRQLIDRAFGAPIYNRYGCREIGDIAHECEAHQGLHVNGGRMIVETVVDSGTPEEEGGEIVVTDLDNHAFPFLRYRMGDVGVFASHACSCGRGYPLLEGVTGRIFDVVHAPNGRSIAGHFFSAVFRSRKGVHAFQVVQKSSILLHVFLVPDAPDVELPYEHYVARIAEAAGPQMQVEFTLVDRIPPHSSGKRKLVIREIA